MWYKIAQIYNTKCFCDIILFNRKVQTKVSKDISVINMNKSHKVKEHQAKRILHPCPSISEQSASIYEIRNSFRKIGLSNNNIISRPTLINRPFHTLHYRKDILHECGVINVDVEILSSYLNIVNTKTIKELKNMGILPANINVKNCLYGCFEDPCYTFHADGDGDEDSLTLINVRMGVLKEYLKKTLNLTDDEFERGIKTYTRLKSRPFKMIVNTMKLLRTELNVPISKVKTNLSVLHLVPENIKLFLYSLKTLAGADVREIFMKRPIVWNTKYHTILEIDTILDTFMISHEARLKCLDIYLLRPETLRRRLIEAKSIPEFDVLFDNPRILSLILYQEKAKSRLWKQSQSDKKCASLHFLLGNSKEYERSIKNTGDKTKGKDLIQGISQALGKPYSEAAIRDNFKKHPFWLNTPLVEAKYVFDKLKIEFSSRDIFLNCSILLYPWTRIERVLNMLSEHHQKCAYDFKIEIGKNINVTDLRKLDNAQLLSLTLYILEKEFYFSGNGVWPANYQVNRGS